MGFPFLAPLKGWITQSIAEREANPDMLNTLMPFAVLSSAAVVTNNVNTKKLLENIIQTSRYDSSAYKGCVVTNSTNMSDNYQLGKTIVGYDLDGKVIEVEGESNRRVSTPIIESIEIDSDGSNNTLKTANVKLKIFTLKQLEMFELFFLRPSMNLVLEYGWNSSIRNKDIEITSRMFANKSHTDYLIKYSEIYSHKNNAYKIAKNKYISTLKDTKGNYDFMAGKVTNFTYSPDADGSYSISLDISAGNELQLWMTIKRAKDEDKVSKTADGPNFSPYQTWVNQLAADLNNPEFVTLLKSATDWEKEFFNWGAVNTTQTETTFSKDAYISFKLILELINNMQLFKDYKEKIKPGHYVNIAGKKEPIIPVSSNYIIISPTTDFILPGKLPYIYVSTGAKQKDVIKLDPDLKNGKDCKIYGKSFNVSNSEKITKYNIYDDDDKPIEVTSSIGNLLNVYFNYNQFKSIYNKAYTSADVINALLSSINSNMFGLCNLELQKESDAETGSPLIIMDSKLNIPHPPEKPENIFRFNVNSINSIVKEFSFNMELSTLMQAQALYSTQLALAATKNDSIKDKLEVPVKDPYQHADLSYAQNADGYYSINAIELQIVKESQEWNATIKKTANVNEAPPKPTDGEEAASPSEVFNKNYIRFKLDENDKNSKNFIYTDAALVQKLIIPSRKKKNTSALTYLDINFAIDGIAGISCGEYFHINGVPEIYNKNGYFQVTNVKQGVDESGWKTTIEAGYRIKADEDV